MISALKATLNLQSFLVCSVLKGWIMKKIIILTSNALRHTYIRKALALDENIKVLKSYCETHATKLCENLDLKSLQVKHLILREQSEKDFFEAFVKLSPDYSKPEFIEKNAINSTQKINEIKILNPDLIITYGCSIIQPPLIKHFKNKIINIHLGLSPYYRGSGTNFFPFVNKELEAIGVTFMYMDEGIDTGEIIHQIRAKICIGDTIHSIGNRLIVEIVFVLKQIIYNLEKLIHLNQPQDKKSGLFYKNSDFTLEATQKAYKNLHDKLIENFLKNPKKLTILENPILHKKEKQ